ncbi:MAG: hypothetical protein JW768_12385 [Chitinispirillaceae bacterium]|nr:hypothetical protein [Chitinispirillaceae bacterium]
MDDTEVCDNVEMYQYKYKKMLLKAFKSLFCQKMVAETIGRPLFSWKTRYGSYGTPFSVRKTGHERERTLFSIWKMGQKRYESLFFSYKMVWGILEYHTIIRCWKSFTVARQFARVIE